MDFIPDDDEPSTPEKIPQHSSEYLTSRPENCGVLQFHTGVEDSLIFFIKINAIIGNPQSVIDTIDIFCYQRHWMMHIGDVKGEILDNALLQLQNSRENSINCAEFGTYCGYSALRLASKFSNPLSVLYCVESNEKCCEWASTIISFAGLCHCVRIIHGDVNHFVNMLKSNSNKKLNFLLIDHAKDKYLSDLLLCEQNDILESRCVVVADNILAFGCAEEYVAHVRDPLGPYESSTLYRSTLEYSTSARSVEKGDNLEDGVEVSIFR